jgi:hypothetical protein
LQQDDVGGHDWELTGLTIHLTGKALLVKSFSSQLTETMSHFSPVPPDMGYRDAIKLLKNYNPSAAAYTP